MRRLNPQVGLRVETVVDIHDFRDAFLLLGEHVAVLDYQFNECLLLVMGFLQRTNAHD